MEPKNAIAAASPTTGTTHVIGEGPPLTPDDIADATSARAATYASTHIGDVVIVDGFGIVVRVRRGCLQLDDGVGEDRRARTVTRAQAGRDVRRVLVLGVGTVTTEAMRWCDEQRLPLVVARPGGAEPYMLGVPVLFDHAGLRCAQALAPYTTVGIEVTRWLLDRRLADQARIARSALGRPDVADGIEAFRPELAEAETTSDALRVEGHAALAYWNGWSGVRATFAPRDKARLPQHWAAFGGRRSPLAAEAPTASNRHAGDVTAGLLNFGYWLAQSEATIALLSMGLDPAMGLCHSNDLNRPAGALDLMEAAGRGAVEEAVLALVGERTLRKASFVESRTGEIRLAAPLAHEVASVLSPVLRQVLGPVAEELAARLLPLVEGRVRISVPTPLSRTRHGRRARPSASSFAPACRGCGVVFPPGERRQRSWCDGCLPEVRRSRDLHEIGPARRRHVARTKPYESAAAAARAEAMRRQTAEQRRWEEAHKGMALPDPSAFDAIRAALAGFRDADIAAAIGVSQSMAGQIRRGRAPHPRHWAALSALAEAGCSSPDVVRRLAAASDPAWFSREVLPRLDGVKLSAIAAACGVNKTTASSWRRGKTAAGPSHWPALGALVGVEVPGPPSASVATRGPRREMAHG
jgi:CRISPR/Cas system-associated endonuclease Cas1/transcriptional regulator with XRE-family HTH domain